MTGRMVADTHVCIYLRTCKHSRMYRVGWTCACIDLMEVCAYIQEISLHSSETSTCKHTWCIYMHACVDVPCCAWAWVWHKSLNVLHRRVTVSGMCYTLYLQGMLQHVCQKVQYDTSHCMKCLGHAVTIRISYSFQIIFVCIYVYVCMYAFMYVHSMMHQVHATGTRQITRTQAMLFDWLSGSKRVKNLCSSPHYFASHSTIVRIATKASV